MLEKEMVQILQRSRHDLMNDLQVIQGYLSMERTDVVKAKLADYIDYYQEERKLLHIHAPCFILWVIGFNHCHKNIKLSYHINGESLHLSKIDGQLLEDSEYVVRVIETFGSKRELYHIDLQLIKRSETNIALIFTIDGQMVLENEYIHNKRFKRIHEKEYENRIIYEISYMIG